ncbi:MAG: hypothetical protein ACK5HP_03885 [Bacilli bacterium]
MDKKLPKMFANTIEKKLENNTRFSVTRNDSYEKVSKKEPKKNYEKSIEQKIKEIFKSPNYVYKIDVDIACKDKTITKKVIGYNNKGIITIENEIIPICEILDIKIKTS